MWKQSVALNNEDCSSLNQESELVTLVNNASFKFIKNTVYAYLYIFLVLHQLSHLKCCIAF